MVSGLFFNISGLTRELKIELFDYDDDGFAVWRGTVGDDARFVEGRIDDDIWVIIDRLVIAYEEERGKDNGN